MVITFSEPVDEATATALAVFLAFVHVVNDAVTAILGALVPTLQQRFDATPSLMAMMVATYWIASSVTQPLFGAHQDAVRSGRNRPNTDSDSWMDRLRRATAVTSWPKGTSRPSKRARAALRGRTCRGAGRSRCRESGGTASSSSLT